MVNMFAQHFICSPIIFITITIRPVHAIYVDIIITFIHLNSANLLIHKVSSVNFKLIFNIREECNHLLER